VTRPHAPDAPAVAKKPGLKITPKLVWNAVRGHPYLTALTVVMAGTVGALVWLFMPMPKHTVYAVYRIASRQVGPVGDVGNQMDLNSYKNRQLAMVKMRLVLNEALKDKVARAAIESKANGDPLGWLDKNLQVESRQSSEQMKVYLEGDNSDELLAVINAVHKAYMAKLDAEENGDRNQQIETQDNAIKEATKEIAAKRLKLGNLGSELHAYTDVGLSALERRLDDALERTREEIRKAERDRDDAAARETALSNSLKTLTPTARLLVGLPAVVEGMLSDLRHQPGTLVEAQLDAEVARDPLMQAAEAKVSAARNAFEATKKVTQEGSEPFKKSHDNLQQATADRDNLRDKIVGELRQKKLAMARDLVLKQQQAELNQVRDAVAQANKRVSDAEAGRKEVEARISKFDHNRQELDTYRKEIAYLETLLNTMRQKREELKVETEMQKRVKLTEDPYVMAGVEGNRRLRNAGMAGAGVLLAGLAGLVGWEVRSRRVTRSDELATALGLPLLGTIPPAEAGIEASGELVEAVDSARTVLLHSDPSDRPLRTLVVTSALPGEGKTSLSGHLAISLARAGYRTLIVDGDVHSPSVHQVFDLDAGPGLCELLRDETGMDAVVRTTRVPGLSVLPAGRWNLTTRQALVGDRWSAIRRQLEKRYDYVIVDTAPLLLMTDSLLLARNADGVILSALLGVTQVNSVAETQTRLNSLGARILGVIVNGARSPYSLRYGYGYGRYKPAGDEAVPAVNGPNSLTPA
jgi:succinoglycan biosynthesis transport protein ExoP